jgi:hypothetical protein
MNLIQHAKNGLDKKDLSDNGMMHKNLINN